VTVREYVVKRAKAEGRPIPDSWNPDGTTEGSGRSTAAIPHRFTAAAIDEMALEMHKHARRPGSRLARAARGQTPRDQRRKTGAARESLPQR
jgi:hypothetical protein